VSRESANGRQTDADHGNPLWTVIVPNWATSNGGCHVPAFQGVDLRGVVDCVGAGNARTLGGISLLFLDTRSSVEVSTIKVECPN